MSKFVNMVAWSHLCFACHVRHVMKHFRITNMYPDGCMIFEMKTIKSKRYNSNFYSFEKNRTDFFTRFIHYSDWSIWTNQKKFQMVGWTLRTWCFLILGEFLYYFFPVQRNQTCLRRRQLRRRQGDHASAVGLLHRASTIDLPHHASAFGLPHHASRSLSDLRKDYFTMSMLINDMNDIHNMSGEYASIQCFKSWDDLGLSYK